MLMSVELMLNAVNLNLVAFDVWLRDTLHAGQALTLFTITIAAAEIGLGLAIVLMVFRAQGTADIDRLRALSDRPGAADGPNGPDGPAISATAAAADVASASASDTDPQGKATVA